MDTTPWDVIVVGGGAAGLSAALMLGRSRRRVLVLDAGSPRNRFAAHMHGVLGHEGLNPAELVARGRAEAAEYGVEVVAGEVAGVEETTDTLTVRLADGTTHTARALVVATGVRDDLPGIPGLAERWGTTVLHCPYCHGWEVRDRRLGVLMTSPMGLHQAELVRQWSEHVTVFTGGIDLDAIDPVAVARLDARGVVVESVPVAAVLGDGDRIEAVRLDDGREVAVDAIFTAGELRPLDGFLAPLGLDRSDTPVGSFLTVDPAGQTSNRRVWAAGNVANPMANVPIAIAGGVMAGSVANFALAVEDGERALRERGDVGVS